MTAAFAETGEYTKHWPKYLTQSRPKVKKKKKKKGEANRAVIRWKH